MSTGREPGAPGSQNIGRLVEASTANTATEFFYDPMGRTNYLEECTPMNCSLGQAWGNAFTYNFTGGMTSISSFGITATQSFDAAGRIAGVTSSLIDSQHPATLAAVDPTAGFFPNGAIRKMTFGNALTTTSVYNSRLQPCLLNVNSTSSLLQSCTDAAPPGNVLRLSLGYGTNNNGDITAFTATGAQAFTRSYGYDALNRVSTMSDSVTAQTCRGLSWGYDGWGNRTAQTTTAGSCFSPQLSFTTRNQLLGAPYLYDFAGNLTNDGNHTYTYDAESRVTKVDGGITATYTYDALGKRVERIVNGGPPTEYVYDAGGNIFWMVEGAGGHLGHYFVRMGGQLLAQYYGSTTNFFHQDHLGSTRLVTQMDKSVLECDDYYAFGELIACGSTTGSVFKFTGKERDTESGLDNFGARYDASSLGRFMTPDWSVKQEPVPYSKLDNPQTLNLYSYVQNNPLSNVDNDGHATIELRYTPVAVGNHTYIVVTDTNGHQTYYRAGPTNGASAGWITPASGGSSTQGAGSNSSNSSNSTTPGAGPGGVGANTGPFGALTAEHGNYVPGTIDYETHPAASVTLLSNDQPASGYTDQLNQYENNINQSNIPYNPLSTNSNAYAEGAANFLGLTPPASPPVLAPGHSTPLPVPPPAPPPPPPPPPCTTPGACPR